MWPFTKKKKIQKIILQGKEIIIHKLKDMDTLEKNLDRKTAKLLTIEVNKKTLYIVEFINKSNKKVYFEMPKKYAKLVTQNQVETIHRNF